MTGISRKQRAKNFEGIDMDTPITFVLIKGLARESGHWDEFATEIKSLYPNAKIQFVDIPSAGSRWQETIPLKMKDVVGSMRQEARREWKKADTALGKSHGSEAIKGKKYLISISFGAMIGINWMQDYPKDFDGAVLINTSLPKLNSVRHRFRPISLPIAYRVLTASSIEEKERAILDLVSNSPEIKRVVHPKWVQIQKKRPVSTINLLRQLSLAATFKPPKNPPHEKILLLASAKDRLASVKCSKKIQQKWEVPLKLHPWGGHELALDDPKWVLREIAGWVDA